MRWCIMPTARQLMQLAIFLGTSRMVQHTFGRHSLEYWITLK